MFSQYIDNLIENIPERKTPYEFDLVIEGGVFNGSYALGILIFLKALEKKNYLKVNRLSGTSIGAVGAFKFLTNQLETSIKNYEDFRKQFQTQLNLNILKKIIDDDFAAMSPEVFERIKNDVLYINYFDVEKKEQILESRYTSREHLRDTILKSCHIPFLSDGSCCVQENGRLLLDGGLPYIFPERRGQQNKRILYISISGASKIKTMFNTRNEKTIHGRFLEGVLDVYNFLSKEKKTAMCSFVDNWSFLDFMILRFKYGTLTLIIYLIYWLIVVGRFILPLAEKSELYHKMLPIWRDACRDGFLFFCF
jgi:predicted patatin/cPLA2 family phospholipase